MPRSRSLSPAPPSATPTLVQEPLKAEGMTKAQDVDEEAEHEFALFGGDAPSPRSPRSPRQRPMFIDVETGAPAREIAHYRSRSKSVSSTKPPFPELHLTDSAFQREHRARQRAYSQVSRQLSRSSARTAVEEEPDQEDDEEEHVDPNKVVWPEGDPENPQNFTTRRKLVILAVCGLLTINATFASSAPSSATAVVATEYGVSTVASALVTSLFLCGYISGPLLWAPASELIGRRPIFLVTLTGYIIFQLPSALAPNFASLVVSRFLAGTFAAAPLTNCGGVLVDIFDPIGRGPAMSVFSAAVFIGPVMGPIVGGALVGSYLGWRWIYWIMMIFGGLCLATAYFLLPETYHPALLAMRAKKMRKENPEKHSEVYAELEKADFSPKAILSRTILRPFKMLFVEPILLLVTVYLSIVYGLLYSLFSVFPIIWERGHGFNALESGLIFIGVGLGTTIGALANIALQRHYRELVPTWHGHPPPEQRLRGAILAGPLLVIGIFWLGWTGNFQSIPWYVPAISTVVLGASFTLVFISFLSYLIDCYLMYAASALAANTICRSALGAGVPLFITQMFSALGIGLACTVIGCIGVAMIPIPILFYVYGPRIRSGSTFAPCLDLHMRERVEREAREKAGKGADA